MFDIGYLIAIYAYMIFALGLLGQLHMLPIIIVTFLWSLGFGIYYKININTFRKSQIIVKQFFRALTKFEWVLFSLISTQIIINAWGAILPEYGFDALWYHLTIPKIFIEQHSIFFIPGGIFYYSVMSKLADLLYIPALMFGNEIWAKLIHFSFGIASLFVLFAIAKKILNRTYAIVSLLIFTSNLVFSWQSTTAYIDLARTFYELLAFAAFLKWYETKKDIWVVESGVLIGLASSVKFLSLSSGLMLFFLYGIYGRTKFFKKITLFSIGIFLPLIPWVAFSFINTGVPFYPFFTNVYPITDSVSFHPVEILQRIFGVLLRSPDPISPTYLSLFPLIPFIFSRLSPKLKIVLMYSIVSLIVFAISPQTGGGRFLLPYLPMYSVLAAGIIMNFKDLFMRKISLLLILFVALSTIIYRVAAQVESVPYMLGRESKGEYLIRNLNFNYGDYIDLNGVLKSNLGEFDRLVVMGIHNMYYIDVSFYDSSYMKSGEWFNYLLVRGQIPDRFSDGVLIQDDKITQTKLYKKFGRPWKF